MTNQCEQSSAIHAVKSLSFTLWQGESLGIVGESGSGKSTTVKMIAKLLRPDSGSIHFQSQDIASISSATFARSPDRGHIQMVFQDPGRSLNPRFTTFRCIADPLLRLGKIKDLALLRERVTELATTCGLSASLLNRYPHQLSGGEQARVGIARAIALRPKLLVLDEPTTALDVSVQAMVLNQLADIRRQLGISIIFVSHHLDVIRLFCSRVLVMKDGIVVEQGEVDQVFCRPTHTYTQALLSAIPRINLGKPT